MRCAITDTASEVRRASIGQDHAHPGRPARATLACPNLCGHLGSRQACTQQLLPDQRRAGTAHEEPAGSAWADRPRTEQTRPRRPAATTAVAQHPCYDDLSGRTPRPVGSHIESAQERAALGELNGADARTRCCNGPAAAPPPIHHTPRRTGVQICRQGSQVVVKMGPQTGMGQPLASDPL